MNNYRLLLLGFVTVSLVFLTGFEKSDDGPLVKSTSRVSSKASREKKIKNKISVLHVNDDSEHQRSLDLSMPFELSENTWLTTDKNIVVPGEILNMFATESKKTRFVDLDGQMLMSQEPEVDKKKSMDGAGILINLKQ